MMTWSDKNTAELFINYYYLLWVQRCWTHGIETATANFIAHALKQNH